MTTTTSGTKRAAVTHGAIETRIATAADRDAWDAYARQHRSATLFHPPAWTELIARQFGHTPRTLVAARGDQLVGVLPLMEVRSFLAGRLLVSLPYATYAGPIADDEAVCDALLAGAELLCAQRGARCIDLRSRTHGTPRNDAWQPDARYWSFRRSLPLHPNECDAFLPRKARAAARQARSREQLVVTHEPEAINTVWRLYARSMRRLASLTYPLRFFRDLAQTFGSDCWVTLVRRGAEPLAGLISLVYRDTVYPYFLGVDERDRRTGATNLIYLGVIERAVRAQLRTFDFGRTRKDNAGPASFKRNQGFEPTTLGYLRYQPDGAPPLDLTPANPRFALARKVWPHLPLAIANPLGAWLSRAIPG